MTPRRLPSLLAVAGLAPWLAVGTAPPAGAAELSAESAAAVFAEAAAACERDGGALFVLSLCGPLLLVDPSSRAVAGNRRDGGGYLVAAGDGVWIGSLPPEVPAANGAVEWQERRWAMLLWPLPADPAERVRRVGHESFHRLQLDLGLTAAPCGSPPPEPPGAALWLRLELTALAGALRAEGGEARQAAAADALLFRASRHALAPAAAAAEEACERHEGLAEYAGVALGWSDPAARRARVARRLEELAAAPGLDRALAEGTGPAYALLLDEAAPGWRRQRGAEVEAAERLAAALPDPPAAAGAADERAAAWGRESLLAAEAARAGARDERLAAYRARLVDGPVLRLPLTTAAGISFEAGAAVALPDLGTVHPAVTLTDRWGTLRVREGGALVAADRTWAAVPAPAADGPLAGDGWALELAPGWGALAGERDGDLEVRHGAGGRR